MSDVGRKWINTGLRAVGTLLTNQNQQTMANTYTQIHIQCVIAVKFRQSLIKPTWKDELHKYITGIVILPELSKTTAIR